MSGLVHHSLLIIRGNRRPKPDVDPVALLGRDRGPRDLGGLAEEAAERLRDDHRREQRAPIRRDVLFVLTAASTPRRLVREIRLDLVSVLLGPVRLIWENDTAEENRVRDPRAYAVPELGSEAAVLPDPFPRSTWVLPMFTIRAVFISWFTSAVDQPFVF